MYHFVIRWKDLHIHSFIILNYRIGHVVFFLIFALYNYDMRVLIVLISALMIAFSANSQNWSPVSNGNKYHYTCDTTQTIFTLFADSFDVQGSDTLFFMNRIVLPCDTCITLSGYQSCGPIDRIFLKNQPQFLMRNCLVSDTSIWCYSPSGFVLYPMLPVLSSWLYDTLNNVAATISDKVLSSVLNNPDSLCIILLSTGDSIVLSKNFGVVKFPVNGGGYFRLYGIEGNTSIGERLAGFMDFFNFNVGDSFVYYVASYNPENYDPPRRWYYSITSKIVFPDGFVYEISGEYCEMSMTCGNPTAFNGSLCFKDNYFCPYTFGYYVGDDSKIFYDSYSYNLILLYENSSDQFVYKFCKRTKTSGVDFVEIEPRSLFTIFPSSQNYNEDILVAENPDFYGSGCNSENETNLIIARSGIGIELQMTCAFENSYTLELLFCISNGDTIVNQLVNTENHDLTIFKPSIFPNPAQKNITISHEIIYNKASIFSTTGKKVKDIILKNEQTEVDVSYLKPGLYFVILEGKNKRTTLKFVVER